MLEAASIVWDPLLSGFEAIWSLLSKWNCFEAVFLNLSIVLLLEQQSDTEMPQMNGIDAFGEMIENQGW